MKNFPSSLLIFILFISCLSANAQHDNPLINSGEILEKASQLYDSGEYKKSMALYQQININDTNYIRALYGMSLNYYADSQYKASTRYLEKALVLGSIPELEPDLYNQYGNSVNADGDPERGFRILDSAIHKYPNYAILIMNKGTVRLQQERFAEAGAIFKQALMVDPYSYSSHFKLGLCALYQGKLIPAMMSFTAYLLVAPSGKFHNNCINLLSAISRNDDDIQKYVSGRKETLSDQYQLLEQIVQSKIALDQNYKPIIHLDDQISRQIQVVFEKLKYDEGDNDFWMQYYVPYFKRIFDAGQFELFINHIFSKVDLPIIQDYNKKNKKEESAFVSDAADYFNMIRESRILNYNKRNTDSILWAYSNGELTGMGKYMSKAGKLTGPWELYYAPGNIKSRGSFDEQGKKTGPWTYYYFNGNIKGKEIYQAGKQEGEETYYFSKGMISTHSWYKNNLPDGESTAYYIVGSPRTITHYSAGKEEGTKISFYSSGDTSLLENYRAGVLEDGVRSLYANGQVDVIARYTKGKLDGMYRKYHENGKLNTEGLYTMGKQEGPWKTWHPNGQLKSEVNYVHDKQEGEYKEYFDNGKPNTGYQFRNGKVSGELRYYDDDGKLYSTYLYENDRLKQAKFIDKTGKLISQSDSKGKTIDVTAFLPEGLKKFQISYDEKGNITGTETFFYRSGTVMETDEYKDGQEDGLSFSHYANGAKKVETNYSAGMKDGYFQSYFIDGHRQQEGWYQENKAQGNWITYDELGKLTDSAYYLNDDLDGYKKTFFPNGKMEFETKYRLGWLEEWAQFDSTGRQLVRNYFPGGKGEPVLLYPDGKPYMKGTYRYGKPDKARNYYYFDGKPMIEEHYKRGLQDSVYKVFSHSGNLNMEGLYLDGKKTGTWKSRYPDGKLSTREEWLDGKLDGAWTRYFENGKVQTEIHYKDDEKDGTLRNYDEDGTLMYQSEFKAGNPLRYTYLGKDGKLVPEIPIPAGTGKLKAFFPNGNPSADFSYQDGMLHGTDKMYHTTGKPYTAAERIYGLLEGSFRIWYPSGQLKAEYNYHLDNLNGPYKEYNEKGVLTEEGNYYNGSPHGTVRIYDDNGAPKEADLYYYGKLLFIKK